MTTFEFVSCDQKSCGGNPCFKVNSEITVVDRCFFKYPCKKMAEMPWGEDDIYWAFLPGKLYNDDEKKAFLEMLNPHYTEIRAACKHCVAYAELNQEVLGELYEPESTNDCVTEDEISTITKGLEG